jgi:hypothetical protein
MGWEAMKVWVPVVIALSMLAVPAAHAADGSGADKPQASDAPPVHKDHVPHLRFRNGPVCMCGNGLSEADIEKAARERKQKEEKLNATGVDQRSKRREQ